MRLLFLNPTILYEGIEEDRQNTEQDATQSDPEGLSLMSDTEIDTKDQYQKVEQQKEIGDDIVSGVYVRDRNGRYGAKNDER